MSQNPERGPFLAADDFTILTRDGKVIVHGTDADIDTLRAEDGDAAVIDLEVKSIAATEVVDSLTLSSTQTIPGTDSFNKVTLDSTRLNQIGGADPDGNQIEIQHDGTYYITGKVQYAEIGGGNQIEIAIFVNGSKEAGNIEYADNAGNESSEETTAILELDEGDTVDLRTSQDSSGDEDINTGYRNTSLDVTRLG